MLLKSNFAILDVKHGRVGLRKKIENGGRVPVTIVGYIDEINGQDDGESQEFIIDVQSVRAGME